MKKLLFVFCAIGTVVAFAPAAFAGTISGATAINFTCSGQSVAGPGKTSLPVGAGCTPYHTGSGTSLKTFEGLNSWSNIWYQESTSGQNYFEVQSLKTSSVNPGSPYVSKTNPGNGKLSSSASALTYHANDGFNYTASQTSATVSTVTSATNIIPSLGSGSGGGIKQLEISDSTGSFFFNGFFFGETTADTTLSYMIFGYDGSTLVYCIDSAGNSCNGDLSNSWATYTPTGSVDASSVYYTLLSLPAADAQTSVTKVYVDTKVPVGEYQYLDNFLVTQTPEPGSLVLLGTGFGLVGVVIFLRRRTLSVSRLLGN
jgi:hypothetical protein